MATKPTKAEAAPVVASAPADPPPQPVKVRATRMGYYRNVRRRPGDVFVVHDRAFFSEKWMEAVDPYTPERVTSGRDGLAALRVQRVGHQHELARAMQTGETGRTDLPAAPPTGATDVLGAAPPAPYEAD